MAHTPQKNETIQSHTIDTGCLNGYRFRSVVLPLQAAERNKPPDRLNILFIAIDDLRPQLGCYGHDEIHSPQIDKLAAQGTLFERAYANSPVCGASRLSVLTGIRAHPNQWETKDMSEEFTTLPAHFKNHGYHAVSIGKVFHKMHDREADWSVPPWRSAAIYHGEKDWAGYNHYGIWQNPESAEHISAKKRGPYRESAEVGDDAYQDGKVADKTIAELKQLKQQDKPFFLACGFWRPHLPFNAPKKYWDLYQREDIALAPNRYKPENLPRVSGTSDEFDGYALTGERMTTDEFHREARHAYYACVSYADAQVGKIIEELDTLGLAENTIIVLWGDHGYHLGEHGFWGKHNTLDHSLHSPLIVLAPGNKKNTRTRGLVEFIDLYPSLCELAGLPVPNHVQGRSFAPLMTDPEQAWKSSLFVNWWGCKAVKTDRYLYTEWRKDGTITHRMLFDHELDPMENINIADKPHAKPVIDRLSALLEPQWER